MWTNLDLLAGGTHSRDNGGLCLLAGKLNGSCRYTYTGEALLPVVAEGFSEVERVDVVLIVAVIVFRGVAFEICTSSMNLLDECELRSVPEGNFLNREFNGLIFVLKVSKSSGSTWSMIII